jgi:hypothetical protein
MNHYPFGISLTLSVAFIVLSSAACTRRAEPEPPATPAADLDALAPSRCFDALAKALRSEPLRSQLSAAVPGWSMNFHNMAYLDGTLNGTPTCQQEVIWRLDVPLPQVEFEAHLPKMYAALESSVGAIVIEQGGECKGSGELTTNANGKHELLVTYTTGGKIGWVQVAQRKDQWSDLRINLSEEPR